MDTIDGGSLWATPAASDGWETLEQRPAWQRDGLCREPAYRNVTFFPKRGEDTRPALAVCARCLVRLECADVGLSNSTTFGIWGGLTERQRRRIRTGRAERPTI